MGFLGMKNKEEQKIFKQNRALISDKIPIQYYSDFLNSIGMKQMHERLISIDEVNIYLSQHPQLQQVSQNVQREQIKNTEKVIYSDYDTEQSIKNDIEQNMKNLAGHESGTSWMKWGAMFSGNGADQITAAGFKALIEQNKILIRQNELIRRQNEVIIELLIKDNEE